MKTAEYEFAVKVEGKKNMAGCKGITEFDEKKWGEIQKICNERKASIYDLIGAFLEELTPEKAENILWSWDI